MKKLKDVSGQTVIFNLASLAPFFKKQQQVLKITMKGLRKKIFKRPGKASEATRALPELVIGQILELGGHQVKYGGRADWGAEFGILDSFNLLTPGMQTSLLLAAGTSYGEMTNIVLERVAVFDSHSKERMSVCAR